MKIRPLDVSVKIKPKASEETYFPYHVLTVAHAAVTQVQHRVTDGALVAGVDGA